MIPNFETPGTREISTWGAIHMRSIGYCIREEDRLKTSIFRESADKTHLTTEEKSDIEILLRALHDAPYWHADIRYLFGDSAGVGDTVVLSEERKTYLELFVERGYLPDNKDDWDNDVVKEIKAYRVLGECKDGTIILYINNIKDAASAENAPRLNEEHNPYLTVIRYVYLHELMHAFFERKENKGYKYNRDKEEEFAEFGALLLLDQLVSTTPMVMERVGAVVPEVNHASKDELEWAVRHVERKKGALECYSRGAGLYKQYGQDKILSKKMLEAYPNKYQEEHEVQQ